MINMSLDDRSSRIKHDSAKSVPIQVAADIEADIDSGALEPDTRLPSEAELATQYGVARVSVRRAIELLRERGKVLTFHGRGTYVAEKPGELEARVGYARSMARRRAAIHVLRADRELATTHRPRGVQRQPVCRRRTALVSGRRYPARQRCRTSRTRPSAPSALALAHEHSTGLTGLGRYKAQTSAHVVNRQRSGSATGYGGERRARVVRRPRRNWPLPARRVP
jgi:GntR family transcriptional regulator